VKASETGFRWSINGLMVATKRAGAASLLRRLREHRCERSGYGHDTSAGTIYRVQASAALLAPSRPLFGSVVAIMWPHVAITCSFGVRFLSDTASPPRVRFSTPWAQLLAQAGLDPLLKRVFLGPHASVCEVSDCLQVSGCLRTRGNLQVPGQDSLGAYRDLCFGMGGTVMWQASVL
jgi:hypothetical protein